MGMRIRLGDRWRWRLEYAAALFLLGFLQILTPRQCAAISGFLAWLIADVVRFRQSVIHENLVGVFPDIKPEQLRWATRRMWRHLALMICEVAQAPRKIHDSNWRRYVVLRDKALMTGSLMDYRPLIAVSGHFGNFELCGFVTGLMGWPTYTIVRALDNPYLDKFINDFRSRNGQFILPKDGSAGAIQDVLHSGGVITILGDQHAGTKGCWVDFLGRPAACHKAVALFTLEGKAPMMVSYCRHLDEPLKVEIGCTGIADPLSMPEELKDIKVLTQWYNDRLGAAIALDPSQYWWVHRRWKEKPVRRTKRTRAAA